MNENMKKAWKSFKEMVEKAKVVEQIKVDSEIKTSIVDPGYTFKTGRVTLTVVINNK